MSTFKVKVGQMSQSTEVICHPGMTYQELISSARSNGAGISIKDDSEITIFFNGAASERTTFGNIKNKSMTGNERIVLTLATKPKGN